MKVICHVDKDGDALILRCPDPGAAGVAFVLIGRLLLATPGAFGEKHRRLLSELLESLVPADFGPPIMVLPREEPS